MPKNDCHIQGSCDSTTSRMTMRLLECSLYCPCQANGQFFHSQCIQSMLPSILGNPLVSFKPKILGVSAAFGSLKYYFPNTATIALQNLYIASRQVDSFILKYSSTLST